MDALKSFDPAVPLSMSMTCRDPDSDGWTLGIYPSKADSIVALDVERGADGRCVISNHDDGDTECCRGC